MQNPEFWHPKQETTEEFESRFPSTLCPISGEVMVTAVLTPSGQSYDFLDISDWIKRSHTDPATRNPLEKKDLIENKLLKELINKLKNNENIDDFLFDEKGNIQSFYVTNIKTGKTENNYLLYAKIKKNLDHEWIINITLNSLIEEIIIDIICQSHPRLKELKNDKSVFYHIHLYLRSTLNKSWREQNSSFRQYVTKVLTLTDKDWKKLKTLENGKLINIVISFPKMLRLFEHDFFKKQKIISIIEIDSELTDQEIDLLLNDLNQEYSFLSMLVLSGKFPPPLNINKLKSAIFLIERNLLDKNTYGQAALLEFDITVLNTLFFLIEDKESFFKKVKKYVYPVRHQLKVLNAEQQQLFLKILFSHYVFPEEFLLLDNERLIVFLNSASLISLIIERKLSLEALRSLKPKTIDLLSKPENLAKITALCAEFEIDAFDDFIWNNILSKEFVDRNFVIQLLAKRNIKVDFPVLPSNSVYRDFAAVLNDEVLKDILESLEIYLDKEDPVAAELKEQVSQALAHLNQISSPEAKETDNGGYFFVARTLINTILRKKTKDYIEKFVFQNKDSLKEYVKQRLEYLIANQILLYEPILDKRDAVYIPSKENPEENNKIQKLKFKFTIYGFEIPGITNLSDIFLYERYLFRVWASTILTLFPQSKEETDKFLEKQKNTKQVILTFRSSNTMKNGLVFCGNYPKDEAGAWVYSQSRSEIVFSKELIYKNLFEVTYLGKFQNFNDFLSHLISQQSYLAVIKKDQLRAKQKYPLSVLFWNTQIKSFTQVGYTSLYVYDDSHQSQTNAEPMEILNPEILTLNEHQNIVRGYYNWLASNKPTSQTATPFWRSISSASEFGSESKSEESDEDNSDKEFTF